MIYTLYTNQLSIIYYHYAIMALYHTYSLKVTRRLFEFMEFYALNVLRVKKI